MKRIVLTGLIGFACLAPLMGCAVDSGPPQPVYVAPAPVLVAPAPVVVGPRYYHRRWYRGRPFVRRYHRYYRHHR